MMKKLTVLLMIAVLLMTTPAAVLAGGASDGAIRLNEVLASCSGKTLRDENGNAPDWVELHNTGTQDVNLAGFCLSDGMKKLDKFVFPEVTIPAGGYLLVYCSGEDRVTETELHTSFKLSSDGETLVLSHNGRVLDTVKTGRQAQDVPLARNEKGKWEKTHVPTKT